MILWSGAQKLGNELFLKLLEVGNYPHVQPPEPCLGWSKQSQGKCIAQCRGISLCYVHLGSVHLDVGEHAG